MRILNNIVTDRGSRYAVSGGPCRDNDDARNFVALLKQDRKFAKATHHSWALICADGPLKSDDGEAGAGLTILRMLERFTRNYHGIIC